ncbi:MAG: hypothetical protein ABMB14_26795 [Myxococcota bacterium]
MTGRTVARFVAIGLAIHLVLSVAFAATIGREHDVRRMDAKWLLGPRPVDVMIAGDSHARFSVEAPILGLAINVAVPGEHYQKSTYRVPWLIDHGTRTVGTVVLPFDAVSFASFKDDSFEPELVWGRYLDWWELGRQKGKYFEFAGRWAKSRIAPYVGEFPTVLQYLTTTRHFRDPTDPQGGLNLTFFENGTDAARRHLEGADVWDPDMEWAFRRLVSELVERRIRVVLVRFPVTRAYAAESRRLGADPALRDQLLTELAKPGVVDHLDFESMFFDSPEMFGDGDHLNPIGKRRFSLTFAEALVRLGVIAQVHAPRQGQGGEP